MFVDECFQLDPGKSIKSLTELVRFRVVPVVVSPNCPSKRLMPVITGGFGVHKVLKDQCPDVQSVDKGIHPAVPAPG